MVLPQPWGPAGLKQTLNLRYVLTGGPGAGKSTLLRALGQQGFTVVEESARAVIKRRKAAGLEPRGDATAFAAAILRRDAANYQQAPGARPVIFDRGLADALCQLDQARPLSPARLRRILARYAYARQVFVLPPWQAIYANDAERDQTFAEAQQVYTRLCAWYRQWGYRLTEVPPAPVRDRAAFVSRAISSGP